MEQEQGVDFNAKTTYLGKVSCFVSVTLLLLYSSCWCCCYLLKSSGSSSSTSSGSDIQSSDSFSMSPDAARTVNSKDGPLLLQLLSACCRNAMNFGCILSGDPQEKGNGVGGGVELHGNWSVQSGGGAAHAAEDKMTLLVTSLVLVSNAITVILFCSYHNNTKLMREPQKMRVEEYREKNENKMMMIRRRMTLCMQICQDFIIKTKIKMQRRFTGISCRCVAVVGGDVVRVGGVVGCGAGLSPKLQVLSEIDRFSSRTLLVEGIRAEMEHKNDARVEVAGVLSASRYLLL